MPNKCNYSDIYLHLEHATFIPIYHPNSHEVITAIPVQVVN